jgi:hypothetical protein
MLIAEKLALYFQPTFSILLRSRGSLELGAMDGDHFWRYVLDVTFLSILLDFAMFSSIKMSAMKAQSVSD